MSEFDAITSSIHSFALTEPCRGVTGAAVCVTVLITSCATLQGTTAQSLPALKKRKATEITQLEPFSRNVHPCPGQSHIDSSPGTSSSYVTSQTRRQEQNWDGCEQQQQHLTTAPSGGAVHSAPWRQQFPSTQHAASCAQVCAPGALSRLHAVSCKSCTNFVCMLHDVMCFFGWAA